MAGLSTLAWFVIAMITILAALLTIAVTRSLRNPAYRQRFDAALQEMQRGEFYDPSHDEALDPLSKRRKDWYPAWEERVSRTGRIVKDPRAPGRTALGAAVFGALFGFLVFPGGFFGFLVAPLVVILLMWIWFGMEANKRIATMEKQLPALLSGIKANLMSGATPQQAVINVASEVPAPLGDELLSLRRSLDLNVPLETALNTLSSRVPSREMKFLVASSDIAVRSGADLAPQVDVIQEIVVQRTRIRQKLRSAVAQVKPTAYLAYAAVPLMFFVSWRSPDNQRFWMGEGIIYLIALLVLYGAAILTIRFMIRGVENT